MEIPWCSASPWSATPDCECIARAKMLYSSKTARVPFLKSWSVLGARNRFGHSALGATSAFIPASTTGASRPSVGGRPNAPVAKTCRWTSRMAELHRLVALRPATQPGRVRRLHASASSLRTSIEFQPVSPGLPIFFWSWSPAFSHRRRSTSGANANSRQQSFRGPHRNRGLAILTNASSSLPSVPATGSGGCRSRPRGGE
jgi:hypothetical protein